MDGVAYGLTSKIEEAINRRDMHGVIIEVCWDDAKVKHRGAPMARPFWLTM